MAQLEGGSFYCYNAQDNLYSSIYENDKLVSKYRTAPPIVEPASKVLESVNNCRSSEASSNEIEDRENLNRNVGCSESSVNLPRYKICIDGIDKIAEASMLKSSYIIYRIRLTRTSDLKSHAVWKRFKDISSWFQELQQKHPELATVSSVKFPSSADSWMGGNSSDPASEFVLKRKLELEVFFKALFSEHPALVRHPAVIEFFELRKLPPEVMSVIATRMAALDLQNQTSSRPSGRGSTGVYDSTASAGATNGSDSKKGSTEDLSWYTYDRSVVQAILSRQVVYDERSARMVRKNDETKDTQRRASGRNESSAIPSVVEIMNFTDEFSKMQRLSKIK